MLELLYVTMKYETMQKPKRVRSRNWCFTANADVDLQTIWSTNKDVLRYMGWAEETAPTTNKKHLQGWVQLINPKDFGVVRRLLGGAAHIESMKGNEHQNQKYISKENKPTMLGNFWSQGFRSDLEDIKKTIDNGGTMMQVAQDHFGDYLRYHSGFTKYREMVMKEKSKDFRKVEVIIYQGPTGTGKTRKAMEHNDVYKIHGDGMKWWDGYEGEKTLVIDEYANQVPCTELLGILDGYQMRLPIKGGHTYALWTKVILTTNLEVIHCNANPAHLEALNRRVTNIEWFDVTE